MALNGPRQRQFPAVNLGRWRLAMIIGGLAIGVGAFTLLRQPEAVPQEEQQAPPALTVTAAYPTQLNWPKTVEASGAVAPWQEAIIGAQVGGYRLAAINVNVGDAVKRGQVLASFDADMLRVEESQLKAGVAQAEAIAAQSEANLKRAEKLKAAGNMSEQDFLESQTQMARSRTQLESARATLAAKQLQLRYSDVVAPDDGTICSRTATLGAVVPVGQELFHMILKDRLEWRGELTADQITQIGAGQKIHLSLPDGTESTAIVRQSAPSLDSQSRMGIIYADIEPGSHARAGMYANGQILLAESPALVVPAASVVVRDGYSYVLQLQSEGETSKVVLRQVTVGRRQGTQVEIAQGLTESGRVVVDGAGFLNDSDVVRVVKSAELSKR